MSLPKEIEDRLSVFQQANDEDAELHKRAVRFIQDSEFVSPGETIHLTYHDAIKTFKAGYKAGYKTADTSFQPHTSYSFPISGNYQFGSRRIEIYDGEQVEVYADGSIRIFK